MPMLWGRERDILIGGGMVQLVDDGGASILEDLLDDDDVSKEDLRTIIRELVAAAVSKDNQLQELVDSLAKLVASHRD